MKTKLFLTICLTLIATISFAGPDLKPMDSIIKANVGDVKVGGPITQVWYTGDRVRLDIEEKGRLPREERMKGYKEVNLINFDYPFDQFPDATPVAVELRPNAENLFEFEHPENAVYVFGPEDGSINQVDRKHCHRFVYIPTHFCVNLSAAVYMVLWDRKLKGYLNGTEQPLHISEVLKEERVWNNMGLHGVGGSV